MNDVVPFAVAVTLVAVVLSLAVVANRIAERTRVPAPAMFLVGAAVASDLVPAWADLSPEVVQRIVTIALVAVLFDGGMHIGWRRFRTSAAAIAWIGVAGTFATAAAVAGLCHVLFGLSWLTSLLIGTALAPTDPAVVFAVLGKKEISGRASTILEGESGANDPVGIALMAAILAAGAATGWHAVGVGAAEFVEQMLLGGVLGVAGGLGLSVFVRRVRLPHPGLYPVRTLAAAAVIYGVTTVVGGSGFLAVFIAGILVGDVGMPFKADVRRFHSSLASLGEIVAFTVLGLTVSLRSLPQGHAWQIGLAVAVLLALVVRPVVLVVLMARVRLDRGERVFVLWAGLKGAVPILLGTFVLASGVAETERIYDIIFVAVAFSVIVQGGLVPWVAARCRIPMRDTELHPWSLDLRFRDEPRGLARHVVGEGSAADGTPLRDLHGRVWVSLVTRDGQLVPLGSDTVLRAGDQIVVHVDPASGDIDPVALFGAPR